MRLDYLVTEEFNGLKVYNILRGPMKVSGTMIKRLKKSGGILLNNAPVRTIDGVKTGDILTVIIDNNEGATITPENNPISVLYEDESFIAVDKPANMAVHPSAGHQTGTLAQAVLWYLIEQGLQTKIRPINRLDRDTSGITLFAKNAYIQDQLARQMKDNRVYKAYLGIVHGVFSPEKGTIRLPIARKEGSIMERVIDSSGYDSITHYETIKVHNDLSLVKFVLETGRTHQIRVHSKAMGHPLLGDGLYSDIVTNLIGRQALHSHQLSFDHPITGKRIELVSPLPEDMKRVLE
ncbi:MAG: RluA family pseudouridine synthase [Clostridiaceae bacterium]|nr:RluA family pseudouridine synthase [Clostridiaceae bacterium]